MSLILVSIDGSKRSERALDAAAERVRDRPGARVELLYVHEPPIRYGRVLAIQRSEDLDRLREQRASVVRTSLNDRAKPSPLDGLTPEEIAKRFPGGVVPKGAPSRTLGSKFRSRR